VSTSVATYTVDGMTCQHCVSSVTEEVGEIEGVRDVAVDLATGEVTVTSESPVSRERMLAAVTEAGYRLTS
jgi:copper chaperone